MIAEKLVGEIVFMNATLADLRKTVSERGGVEMFEQGVQKYLRESPALKAYNTTIQRYSQICRQLVDMIPKQAQERAESALEAFIKQG